MHTNIELSGEAHFVGWDFMTCSVNSDVRESTGVLELSGSYSVHGVRCESLSSKLRGEVSLQSTNLKDRLCRGKSADSSEDLPWPRLR